MWVLWIPNLGAEQSKDTKKEKEENKQGGDCFN